MKQLNEDRTKKRRRKTPKFGNEKQEVKHSIMGWLSEEYAEESVEMLGLLSSSSSACDLPFVSLVGLVFRQKAVAPKCKKKQKS